MRGERTSQSIWQERHLELAEFASATARPQVPRSEAEGSAPRKNKNGAAYVTRTRDPIITNDVLYQLS